MGRGIGVAPQVVAAPDRVVDPGGADPAGPGPPAPEGRPSGPGGPGSDAVAADAAPRDERVSPMLIHISTRFEWVGTSIQHVVYDLLGLICAQAATHVLEALLEAAGSVHLAHDALDLFQVWSWLC